MVESLQNEARLQTENHAMQLQNMQYQHIQTQISESRKTRHDLRHHLTAISSFVEQEDYDKLKDYLSSYVTPTIWQSQVQYCSNTVLNIMLSYYSAKCISNDIDCHMVLQIPEELPLSDTEITILFGNLLENAVDACLSIPEGTRRQLSLYGREMNHNLLFTVENTFSNPIRQTKRGEFHSTKHKGLGLGISSCKDIVSRHEGEMEITTEDRFRVNILLPLHTQSH